jgi:SAM-dependent methyltransferase
LITKPRKSNEIDDSYIAECFAGERIYGDDFDADALQDWFASESGAYQALGSDSAEAGESGSYPYHTLNNWHGFRHLGTKNFKSVLCLGGGDAEEITDAGILAVSITVVEPLTPSVVEDEGGSSRAGVIYVSATAEGDLDLEDDSIDLITCFGTLHHIANVSYVLTEMARYYRSGNILQKIAPTNYAIVARKPG